MGKLWLKRVSGREEEGFRLYLGIVAKRGSQGSAWGTLVEEDDKNSKAEHSNPGTPVSLNCV